MKFFNENLIRIHPLYRYTAKFFHPLFFKHRHGTPWISRVGHRRYVGGYWNHVGEKQFQFLKERGLLPHHVLLDIGCGALRGGVHFIRYLDYGNYLGIEKESQLIQAGIRKELGLALFVSKGPEFLVNGDFEFEKLVKRPDFAFAHSVFTHLTPADILICLRNLRRVVLPGFQLYASFFEGDLSATNLSYSSDHFAFYYRADELAALGDQAGWCSAVIPHWKTPEGQKMMLFKTKSEPSKSIPPTLSK